MRKLAMGSMLTSVALISTFAHASTSGHTVQTGGTIVPDQTLCFQEGWSGGTETDGSELPFIDRNDTTEIVTSDSFADPILGTTTEPHVGHACWRISGGVGYPGVGDPKSPAFEALVGHPNNPTAQADMVQVTFWFKAVSPVGDGSKIETSIGNESRYGRLWFNPWMCNLDDAEGGLQIKLSEQVTGETLFANIDRSVWHKVSYTYQFINATNDAVTIELDDSGSPVTADAYNYHGITAKGGSMDFRIRHETHWDKHPECRGFYIDDMDIKVYNSYDPQTILYRYATGFERKGDADYDGDVDNVDFGRLYGAFTGPGSSGKTWENGDFDDDGDVDNVDFGTLYGNYTGPLAGGMDLQVTPEPATLILLGLSGAALLRRRSRK